MITALSPETLPPTLLKICRAMDDQLALYVGPLAPVLCREAMQTWLQDGMKLTPTDLRAYARILSGYIPDSRQRRQFETEVIGYIQKLI